MKKKHIDKLKEFRGACYRCLIFGLPMIVALCLSLSLIIGLVVGPLIGLFVKPEDVLCASFWSDALLKSITESWLFAIYPTIGMTGYLLFKLCSILYDAFFDEYEIVFLKIRKKK